MRAIKIAGWIVLGVAAAGALGLALGALVMVLWNWLMPEVFGLPTIGYWKAVGLFILCHLLFKSHHQRGHRGREKNESGGRGHRFATQVHSLVSKDDEPTGEASPTP